MIKVALWPTCGRVVSGGWPGVGQGIEGVGLGSGFSGPGGVDYIFYCIGGGVE